MASSIPRWKTSPSNEGVEKLLGSSNPYKASGPDMIPARLLKECSNELALIFATIFSKSPQTGICPADWKQANVSAVFKKGQRVDHANYRPVSLTCLFYKLPEHVIVSKVMKHVDYHNILTDSQRGFRRRMSCETQQRCDGRRNIHRTQRWTMEYWQIWSSSIFLKLLIVHPINVFSVKSTTT